MKTAAKADVAMAFIPFSCDSTGFGYLTAYCSCIDMLGVVDSSLKMVKFEPTTFNMSQQSGQMRTTGCAQPCCNTWCWHAAIVWPGL